jgi:hypothetical protein
MAMNRDEALRALGEFHDAHETVEALELMSDTAGDECGMYMNDAARTIEGLYELADDLIKAIPIEKVTA